jgi:hypothetical protein
VPLTITVQKNGSASALVVMSSSDNSANRPIFIIRLDNDHVLLMQGIHARVAAEKMQHLHLSRLLFDERD